MEAHLGGGLSADRMRVCRRQRDLPRNTRRRGAGRLQGTGRRAGRLIPCTAAPGFRDGRDRRRTFRRRSLLYDFSFSASAAVCPGGRLTQDGALHLRTSFPTASRVLPENAEEPAALHGAIRPKAVKSRPDSPVEGEKARLRNTETDRKKVVRFFYKFP